VPAESAAETATVNHGIDKNIVYKDNHKLV